MANNFLEAWKEMQRGRPRTGPPSNFLEAWEGMNQPAPTSVPGTPAAVVPGQSPNWTLEAIANNLFQQTNPVRQELVDQSTNFLQGGMDPRSTPEFAAIKSYADQQAKQASNSILETLPSGGTLLDKLADVEIGKARTLTDASAGIYGDNLSRAMSLATGGIGGAISARSGAEQLTAAREQANADRDSAAKGGVGTAIGGALGGGLVDK